MAFGHAVTIHAHRAVGRLLGPRLGDFAELLRVMRTRRFALAAFTTFPIWTIETSKVPPPRS